MPSFLRVSMKVFSAEKILIIPFIVMLNCIFHFLCG